MSEYVPTTEAIRQQWNNAVGSHLKDSRNNEFLLWLNSVKADAFADGAAKQREIVEHKLGHGQTIVIPDNPYRNGG